MKDRVKIRMVHVLDAFPEQVRMPITVPYARGSTNEVAVMSASAAEDLAHQLIVAAAQVRKRRQETARG